MSAIIVQFPQSKISHWNQIQSIKRPPHPFDLCVITDVNTMLDIIWPHTTASKAQTFNPDF